MLVSRFLFIHTQSAFIHGSHKSFLFSILKIVLDKKKLLDRKEDDLIALMSPHWMRGGDRWAGHVLWPTEGSESCPPLLGSPT